MASPVTRPRSGSPDVPPSPPRTGALDLTRSGVGAPVGFRRASGSPVAVPLPAPASASVPFDMSLLQSRVIHQPFPAPAPASVPVPFPPRRDSEGDLVEATESTAASKKEESVQENCLLSLIETVCNAVANFFSAIFCCFYSQSSSVVETNYPVLTTLDDMKGELDSLSSALKEAGLNKTDATHLFGRLERLFNALHDFSLPIEPSDESSPTKWMMIFEGVVYEMRQQGYTVTRDNGCFDGTNEASKPISYTVPHRLVSSGPKYATMMIDLTGRKA